MVTYTSMREAKGQGGAFLLSVVIPAHNEEENLAPTGAWTQDRVAELEGRVVEVEGQPGAMKAGFSRGDRKAAE